MTEFLDGLHVVLVQICRVKQSGSASLAVPCSIQFHIIDFIFFELFLRLSGGLLII